MAHADRQSDCARCWPTMCLRRVAKAGRISPQHFIVQTLVTTQMVRRIGDSYGVRTIGDLLVGFKWIAQAIDQYGPELFIYGTEESHGYMAGSYVRDKDGAVASMLLCELAAKLKAAGQTLHEKLDVLFWQHGVHVEKTVSVQMPGSEGHGPHEGSDGGVSVGAAGGNRRRAGSADSRLRAANGAKRVGQPAG